MTFCKREEALFKFMEKHRIRGKHTSNPTITHLSYGGPNEYSKNGKYNIPEDKIDIFMDDYISVINSGSTNISILEKQKEISFLFIDIDLKVSANNIEKFKGKNHLYDFKFIEDILQKIMIVINDNFDYNKEKFIIGLFEKTKYTQKDDYYKDGIHIIFSKLRLPSKIRHKIREEAIKLMEADEDLSKKIKVYMNPINNIIDRQVISSNGWYMYGSSRTESESYLMTRYFNCHLKDFPVEFETEDIIKAFSIYHNRSLLVPEKTTRIKKDSIFNNIADIKDNSVENKLFTMKNTLNDSYDDYNDIIYFLDILNQARVESYEEWLKVGFAIYNTNPEYLDLWIEFSKRSQKYDIKEIPDVCYKQWMSFKNDGRDANQLLTIRSLAYWAKQDNPGEYNDYLAEKKRKKRDDSNPSNTFSIALYLYEFYKDKYVCSSLDNNKWYEFCDYRWEFIEQVYTLKNNISEEFCNEYIQDKIEILKKRLVIEDNREKERLDAKEKELNKIINNLKGIDYKDKIIKDARNLFYNKKFNSVMDENRDIICFSNGTYNLKIGTFSTEGKPDDYITFCTNIRYTEYSEKLPYLSDIKKFFKQVFPDKKLRIYFLTVLASCLSGDVKHQKIYFLIGGGSNGKSLTMEIINNIFGEYFLSCSPNIITKSRNKSNEASPDIVKLKGKRFVVLQEPDKGEKINIGAMKELTGGDRLIARDLYHGASAMLEFYPQSKFFLTCNYLPIIPSLDYGTWRRIVVIEFKSKFVRKPRPNVKNEFKINYDLKNKIHLWKESIASYLIHIYNTQYKKNNYVIKEPPEVLNKVRIYKSENDQVREFYKSNFREAKNDNSDSLLISELYSEFKEWLISNHPDKQAKIVSLNEFSKEIIDLHPYAIDSNNPIVSDDCDEGDEGDNQEETENDTNLFDQSETNPNDDDAESDSDNDSTKDIDDDSDSDKEDEIFTNLDTLIRIQRKRKGRVM